MKSSMIPIFDLDDTLYPELTFVHSGFQAVAEYLELNFGIASSDSFEFMLNSLKSDGRGAVFNSLLNHHGMNSNIMVKKCVSVYRNHTPNISLNTDAQDFLGSIQGPVFLVTDGNKLVQAKKVDALKLESSFTKIYITHRYGIHNCKPSTHCFELIRESLKCKWTDLIYVGDNPSKDFVNLKPLGVNTVRILTGEYSKVIAKPNFDADTHIQSLAQLKSLFKLDLL
jgi:putative hydrolase of the HAD superfamily